MGSKSKGIPVDRSDRRQRFIDAYNRNAMNFVPDVVARVICRGRKSQADMQAQAASWIEHENERRERDGFPLINWKRFVGPLHISSN